MAAPGPTPLSGGAADLADAMLAGPWRAELMSTRATINQGGFLVHEDVRRLTAAVLHRFPAPPPRPVLIDALLGWLTDTPAAAIPGPALFPADPGLPDLAAVAHWLDLDDGELDWFADLQGRERSAASPLRHYRWRVLPKRGGVRLVAAPKPRLKEIQRRLLRRVVSPLPLHAAAHGCVPGRSVRTALLPHGGSAVVIRADLESFFASVTAPRVRGLLGLARLSDPVARIITGLCTTVVPRHVWRDVPRPADVAALDAHLRHGRRLRVPHLPQGAPTSPALANAVAFRLDRRLTGLAARFGGRYTRYVDDLTFSGGGDLRRCADLFLGAVRTVVSEEGFRLAEHKTAVLSGANRQAALGAVLNDRPTLRRSERDRLRAIVHNCVAHGPASQSGGRPDFRGYLVGRVAAVSALDPPLGEKLRAQVDRINWSG